jgi:hypothetical protein
MRYQHASQPLLDVRIRLISSEIDATWTLMKVRIRCYQS